jgi:TolB protein
MQSRHLLLASALGLLLLALREFSSTHAADTDRVAWGATDPTWSPDGAKLAFSLFGSIWQVDSAGGEATQLTATAGYHAHPSWSPNGSQIAFISGNVPAGPQPNVSGKLMVLDLAARTEREISTPFPTSGTPTWTSSSTSVLCGLLVPSQGSLLHQIPVDGTPSRQLQFPMQRGPVGPWVSASVAGNTVFLTNRRNSPIQIWSMPAIEKPIIVQMPLTRYRPTDIFQITSIAALPDGSGVVYSGAHVNGKGDHDLWRIGARGGQPSAITSTARDEFSPAISRDGRWIAHVSNHLGNLDLFVIPAAGGDRRHVAIGKLKFRNPSGRVRIKLLDETGQSTRARLYVIASDGKAYTPRGNPIFYQTVDPGRPREGFFVASGDDEFDLPAGRLRLVAVKGFEYRVAERTVDVPAGQTQAVTIQLERWTNWMQRGWYTGENHFHANYNGSYYQRPADSLAWLEAEDLNAANMIVANSEGAFVHDKEFFTGGVSSLSTSRYVLYWGQEYRNSDPLGHMAFLNIKKQVPPSYTSVIGSNSPYDFPLNTMAAVEARKQGGLVSYVHPMAVSNDVYDTNLGAKESPLTAALGGMDAIDVLPRGGAAYELWYRLLNAGFHIVPGAGTDVFTNWRGVNNIPGSSRQYVDVGSKMDWQRWIDRYREGRAFVSNGPLLTFNVNGSPAGTVAKPAAGSTFTARLSAEVSARMPIDRLELIQNGQVIAATAEPRISKEVALTASSWFAARAFGPPAIGVIGPPQAHSAAIYVEFGGNPTLVKEDIELMLSMLERQWAYLEERNNFGPGDNRARARAMFDRGLGHYRDKLARATQ